MYMYVYHYDLHYSLLIIIINYYYYSYYYFVVINIIILIFLVSRMSYHLHKEPQTERHMDIFCA